MADLTISVNVDSNRTMSQYMMAKNGKLTFFNAHTSNQLVVRPKGAAIPFCENNKTTKIPVITVAKNSSKTVRICDDFNESKFLYSAQIGSATAEDPIVIIENYASINPIVIIEVAALVIVGIVGALIGYRIARNRMRGAAS